VLRGFSNKTRACPAINKGHISKMLWSKSWKEWPKITTSASVDGFFPAPHQTNKIDFALGEH